MVSLFLVTQAFENVSSSIPVIQKAGDKEDVVVIALDFWAGKKLRDRGVIYKTPDEYLDRSIYNNIDTRAREMAQTWYKPLGDNLVYQNIPLGEMAEYDFLFLFIDALRNIEIATKIISDEAPDIVFLPAMVSLSKPNTVCYETLPKALHYLARLDDIPVTVLRPSSRAIFLSNVKALESKARALVSRIITGAYHIYHSRHIRLNHRAKNIILFTNGALCSKIAPQLDQDKNLCLQVSPAKTKTGRTRRQAKKLRKLWAELKQDEGSSRKLAYNNVPLFQILDDQFQQFFNRRALTLIESIEWADKLIQQLKPRILVVMEDVSLVERTVCRAFKLHGLPALVMQHGLFAIAPNNDFVGFEVLPLEAQKQAVWGDICREWSINKGKSPQSQIVTGNPSFDLIATGYHPEKSKVCHKLGLDSERGIIVLATEWFAGASTVITIETWERFIRSAIRALKAFPQEQIVVKLHPGGHRKYRPMVSAIADEEKIKVTITKDYLWELLANCELLITSNSTVGLEAMILDKPVINVDLVSHLEEITYVSSGAALGTYQPEDIALMIEKVLNNEQVRQGLAEARKKFVYEYGYIQDGKASKRVSELISQMIPDNRSH